MGTGNPRVQKVLHVLGQIMVLMVRRVHSSQTCLSFPPPPPPKKKGGGRKESKTEFTVIKCQRSEERSKGYKERLLISVAQ